MCLRRVGGAFEVCLKCFWGAFRVRLRCVCNVCKVRCVWMRAFTVAFAVRLMCG